jgi:hypothetical protein
MSIDGDVNYGEELSSVRVYLISRNIRYTLLPLLGMLCVFLPRILLEEYGADIFAGWLGVLSLLSLMFGGFLGALLAKVFSYFDCIKVNGITLKFSHEDALERYFKYPSVFNASELLSYSETYPVIEKYLERVKQSGREIVAADYLVSLTYCNELVQKQYDENQASDYAKLQSN